jgi:hypothetical protein
MPLTHAIDYGHRRSPQAYAELNVRKAAMYQGPGASGSHRASFRKPRVDRADEKVRGEPGQTGKSGRSGLARMQQPGCPIPDQPDRSREDTEPQPTRQITTTHQITISTASSPSGRAVWYSLAHANGQNLWPSLGEHAPGSGNHTCKPQRGRALDKEAESWQQALRFVNVNSGSG